MVTLELGICRIEIAVQDPALERQLAALGVAQGKASEVKRTLRYRIRGSGPFEIREERDRLARVDGVETAVAMVVERGLRRAAELLVLSGWAPLAGRIMRQETHIFALIEPASSPPELFPARHLWIRGDEMLVLEVSTSRVSHERLNLSSIAAVIVAWTEADHDQPKEPTPAKLVADLLQSSPLLGAPRSALIRAASRLAMLPSFAVAAGSIDDALKQFPSPSPPERPL